MQPIFTLLWICAWLLIAPAVYSDTPQENPVDIRSRFDRTVVSLQQSTPEQQAKFAASALFQLTETYIAEAELARVEAAQKEGGERDKLLGWSQAVDQFAVQLLLLLDEIERGTAVVFLPGKGNSVALSIADKAVMLAHPRSDQQTAFERSVLADFCGRNDCERLTASNTALEPIPMSSSGVKPRWSFTESGQLCSYGGIEVRFASTRNLGALRGVCEELMREAMTLANDIAWQQRHGVRVGWDELLISATPRRPEHLVRLNAAGDSILLTLPLLFRSSGLLEDIKPWLRAKASGGDPATVRLEATAYGWDQAGRAAGPSQ